MQNNLTRCLLVGIVLLFSISSMVAQRSADVRYTTDTVSPKAYCINGLAINLTKTKRHRVINVRDINLGSSDNIGIKTLLLEKHNVDAITPGVAAAGQIRFTEKDLGKHKIDLWVGDFGGNWTRNSTYIIVSDLTDQKNAAVAKTQEVANFPNPFNDRTKISFTMERTGPASIEILNSKGNTVKEISKIYPEGKQFVEINKSDLPSVGVYYYRITTEQGSITKNMIMVNY